MTRCCNRECLILKQEVYRIAKLRGVVILIRILVHVAVSFRVGEFIVDSIAFKADGTGS